MDEIIEQTSNDLNTNLEKENNITSTCEGKIQVKSESDSPKVQESSEDSNVYGKFKDGESLLSAYNSLQAEFTRKSQKLSDVLKEMQKFKKNNATEKVSKNNNIDTTCDGDQEGDSLHEEAKLLSWSEKFDKYFKENPEYLPISLEIGKTLSENPKLKELDNCFDIAQKIVNSEMYMKPEELVKSKKFLNEHIFSNVDIKKQIISEYLNSINKVYSPSVIQGSSNNLSKSNFFDKPKTIGEASKLAKKYFE